MAERMSVAAAGLDITPQRGFHFLDLPGELRDIIYAVLLDLEVMQPAYPSNSAHRQENVVSTT